MAGDIDLVGAEQLRRSLAAAGEQLEDLSAAHKRAGQLLEERAEADAPRDTGFLSQQHDVLVDADQVSVGNTARYAPAVHARDPWLARTLDVLTNEVVDIYNDQVDQIVDSIRGA